MIKKTVTPGNVLIVFDESGSMKEDWMGQSKWLAANQAMTQALTPLQDQIALGGAIFFPNPDECVVDARLMQNLGQMRLPHAFRQP